MNKVMRLDGEGPEWRWSVRVAGGVGSWSSKSFRSQLIYFQHLRMPRSRAGKKTPNNKAFELWSGGGRELSGQTNSCLDACMDRPLLLMYISALWASSKDSVSKIRFGFETDTLSSEVSHHAYNMQLHLLFQRLSYHYTFISSVPPLAKQLQSPSTLPATEIFPNV